MTLPRTKPVHAGNASLSSLILSMGPVGYWPMLNALATDESTGGSDGDFLSTGDIDFYTNPSRVNREIASSTEFGGTSGYFDTNKTMSLSGTIWLIVTPTTVPADVRHIASQVGGSVGRTFVRMNNGFYDGVVGAVATLLTSGVSAVAGQSARICMKWDGVGNECSITVDDTKVTATQTEAVSGTNDLYAAALNRLPGSNIGFFPGIVSHLAVFDRAITDAECNALRLTALNGA